MDPPVRHQHRMVQGSESRTDILADVLTSLAEHGVALPTPLDRVTRNSRP
jgi:hypothetical protein